ncbi:arsinothricin resistance N-acetyltransferase ArsN1 family B [Kangiella shandongensis]|uniref:arsinothricin resistance N-acetyltransferase ArsN1 family B n=1 Tax=Kangiella shandongensis TaxID=2763258 RepID=UPI001CC15E2F|nr:arsinothricin resistance N-acetyltransferase ArsN1 family B [Kangiella shandongensis]
MIRNASPEDASIIANIYNYYIQNTIVTFETEQVPPSDIAARIQDTIQQGLPYLVYEENGHIIGYAYASKWKGRCAYRFSVEVSVYLSHRSLSKGLGTELYRKLFTKLQNSGYHAAMGGISLPNPASIALHEKMGMEQVAHFKEVGFKFNKWVDVGYWQKVLN